jgi:hypothetical protein
MPPFTFPSLVFILTALLSIVAPRQAERSQSGERELYDAVVAASFFDIPSPANFLGNMRGDLDPYHVELKVTMASTTHEVAWNIGTVGGRAAVAASPSAVKLEALATAIRRVVEEDSGVTRCLRRV